ncbi:DUF1643 domain-containing protein [Kribbella sp. NPDC058245]|uniref:DUF1643 domain-containing protein n=1 Tax=Kribbella sp. NPDC058245 TaxID=3346399 RepID=UPI0036F115B6
MSTGPLGAILLNPPTGDGRATLRHLDVVCDVLGHSSVRIANLFASATASVAELNRVGRDPAGWEAARPAIENLIEQADTFLIGWGVSGLSGVAARHKASQVTWLRSILRERDVSSVWSIGGEPRHPSRWHQYVSDRYARVPSGSFRQRLSCALVEIDV